MNRDTMNHGGDLSQAMRRHGGERAQWLDLSTGINPWSWPIPPQLLEGAWRSLPSRDAEAALRDAARAAYRVPDDAAIIAAPGSQALIQWLPRLAPCVDGGPGEAAILGPTYSEYEACWSRVAGVTRLSDLAALPQHVRHLVVANPNNPDGRVTTVAVLAQAAEEIAKRGGWLVIDEAFADTDPDVSAVSLCESLPVVVLRSFGKFHGLAGLRLGFAIAPPAIATTIAQALGPWAVSGPALAIGAAALADHAWAAAMRETLCAQARDLDATLAGAGLTVIGGTTLFRLARRALARDIHDALARRHVWTRVFDWDDTLIRFGLPGERSAQLAHALAAI